MFDKEKLQNLSSSKNFRADYNPIIKPGVLASKYKDLIARSPKALEKRAKLTANDLEVLINMLSILPARETETSAEETSEVRAEARWSAKAIITELVDIAAKDNSLVLDTPEGRKYSVQATDVLSAFGIVSEFSWSRWYDGKQYQFDINSSVPLALYGYFLKQGIRYEDWLCDSEEKMYLQKFLTHGLCHPYFNLSDFTEVPQTQITLCDLRQEYLYESADLKQELEMVRWFLEEADTDLFVHTRKKYCTQANISFPNLYKHRNLDNEEFDPRAVAVFNRCSDSVRNMLSQNYLWSGKYRKAKAILHPYQWDTKPEEFDEVEALSRKITSMKSWMKEDL